ncbi:hypothetical protein KC640_01575 [Candidatus Dojkabacteria bacterium]|uniref:Uncharacterized protein n=1 Tax=Candidatus Dojkabacteria bacterium TaxID=2099670 RepID=A0A955I723_9BACT|nr:hypothetical protein [Candidatus Dojkabacteria bacterium]
MFRVVRLPSYLEDWVQFPLLAAQVAAFLGRHATTSVLSLVGQPIPHAVEGFQVKVTGIETPVVALAGEMRVAAAGVVAVHAPPEELDELELLEDELVEQVASSMQSQV